MTKKHRDTEAANRVIAFSVSYERKPLLARGLGLPHLREMVQRLARALVRKSANIAYAGRYDEGKDDNFTYLLLQLISAELEDLGGDGHEPGQVIGKLINHSVWPHLLKITPGIEAKWINCCRIIRITQEAAGIAKEDVVHDVEQEQGSDRYLFNGAIALTRMRDQVMTGMTLRIPIPGAPVESIAPISARIALGGKLEDYRGFVPGIFQEALVTLERGVPLYILGGFGGAAATLAEAFLRRERPSEMTLDWHKAHKLDLQKLEDEWERRLPPSYVRGTQRLLDDLWGRAEQGIGALQTGLDNAQAKELLTTCDLDRAVQLVKIGLAARLGIHFDEA